MSILQVDVPGFPALVSFLQAIDMEELAQTAVEDSTAVLLNRTRKRYLAQVDPYGMSWEPSYAAFYRHMTGRDGGTLFDTGTLFHSIQLYEIAPMEAGIGTDVPYAKFHNEGTAKLPRRQFLGFSQEDETLALNVFLSVYNEAFSDFSNSSNGSA